MHVVQMLATLPTTPFTLPPRLSNVSSSMKMFFNTWFGVVVLWENPQAASDQQSPLEEVTKDGVACEVASEDQQSPLEDTKDGVAL